jgi:uncharacterized protein (TIGR00251 family)
VVIRLQPRAGCDRIQGERAGALVIQLKAAPVDGAANAALLRFLADQLGVPAASVELVRGATSRSKWIRVQGWSGDQVRAALLG